MCIRVYSHPICDYICIRDLQMLCPCLRLRCIGVPYSGKLHTIYRDIQHEPAAQKQLAKTSDPDLEAAAKISG